MADKRLFDVLKKIKNAVQSVSKGGTGATTASGARANLGLNYYISWEIFTTGDITIPAGDVATGSISVAKESYDLIGVAGFNISGASSGGTLWSRCTPYSMRIENSENRIYYGIRNTAEQTTAKVKLTVYAIYRLKPNL